MHPYLQSLQHTTRRHFLRESVAGLGGLALASLLGRNASAAAVALANPLAVRRPHFAARAKRVIYLHLTGSPPNLDLFDYKPELVRSILRRIEANEYKRKQLPIGLKVTEKSFGYGRKMPIVKAMGFLK